MEGAIAVSPIPLSQTRRSVAWKSRSRDIVFGRGEYRDSRLMVGHLDVPRHRESQIPSGSHCVWLVCGATPNPKRHSPQTPLDPQQETDTGNDFVVGRGFPETESLKRERPFLIEPQEKQKASSSSPKQAQHQDNNSVGTSPLVVAALERLDSKRATANL